MLLTIAAACMWMAGAVNANAQGKSCEDAPAWSGNALIFDFTPYTDGAWYTVKCAANSMVNLSLSNIPTSAITMTEGCGGKKAIVLSETPDSKSGAIAFYCEAEVEYKMHFDVAQANDAFISINGSTLPIDGAPEGYYCIKPIDWTMGIASPIKANRPTWFKMTVVYPGMYQVVVSAAPGATDVPTITSLSAKSGDCGAVANVSSALTPDVVYCKSGDNYFCVTCSGEAQVYSTMYMMAGPISSCQNRPQRANAIEVNKDYTYPNAVYENYWRFIAPESKTYYFSTKAPEGTILQVGKLDETLEGDVLKYSCNFENAQMGEVGESGEVEVAMKVEAGETYMVFSETFDFMKEGLPSVKVSETGNGISSTEAKASSAIKVGKAAQGEYVVSSYLLKEGAGVYVYDMAGNQLENVNVVPTEGSVNVKLGNVPTGVYMFLVVGQSRSASAKVVVD